MATYGAFYDNKMVWIKLKFIDGEILDLHAYMHPTNQPNGATCGTSCRTLCPRTAHGILDEILTWPKGHGIGPMVVRGRLATLNVLIGMNYLTYSKYKLFWTTTKAHNIHGITSYRIMLESLQDITCSTLHWLIGLAWGIWHIFIHMTQWALTTRPSKFKFALAKRV